MVELGREIDTEPSYSFDAELNDELIGEALSSPPEKSLSLFLEESLLPSQSLFVGHARTGRPVHELSSPSSSNSKKQVATQKMSSKNYGADQQRLQISDLHFDKFSAQATLTCRKIRFKIEVCICSQFPTEAMQWIKEVELVDSVDELRSSSSTCGISMPNFEVLDGRIASALNRVIHNSYFKRGISLGEQKTKRTVSFEADRLPT